MHAPGLAGTAPFCPALHVVLHSEHVVSPLPLPVQRPDTYDPGMQNCEHGVHA